LLRTLAFSYFPFAIYKGLKFWDESSYITLTPLKSNFLKQNKENFEVGTKNFFFFLFPLQGLKVGADRMINMDTLPVPLQKTTLSIFRFRTKKGATPRGVALVVEGNTVIDASKNSSPIALPYTPYEFFSSHMATAARAALTASTRFSFFFAMAHIL